MDVRARWGQVPQPAHGVATLQRRTPGRSHSTQPYKVASLTSTHIYMSENAIHASPPPRLGTSH